MGVRRFETSVLQLGFLHGLYSAAVEPVAAQHGRDPIGAVAEEAGGVVRVRTWDPRRLETSLAPWEGPGWPRADLAYAQLDVNHHFCRSAGPSGVARCGRTSGQFAARLRQSLIRSAGHKACALRIRIRCSSAETPLWCPTASGPNGRHGPPRLKALRTLCIAVAVAVDHCGCEMAMKRAVAARPAAHCNSCTAPTIGSVNDALVTFVDFST
jgi:hypothetical protein